MINLIRRFSSANTMKKLRNSVILIFTVYLSGILWGSSSLGQDMVAGSQPGKGIRVGVFQNYPVSFEKDSLLTGFHLEVLKEVAKQEGWTLNFIHSGSLKNVLQGLEIGSLDIGIGLAPTAESIQYLDFTKEKNALLSGQIFIKRDRDDIQKVNDLTGKKVALLNHDALGKICIEVCQKLGVTPMFSLINSYDELARGVSSGVVDAAIFNSFQGNAYSDIYQLKPTGIVFKPVEMQYAVAKDKNGYLIEAIDRSLRKWKKENGAQYYELEKAFFGGLSSEGGQWTKRQSLIAACLCLLFIFMGVKMGFFLVNETESSSLRVAGASLKKIALFVIIISMAFWLIDSLAGWLLFNEGKNLSLLEFAVTNIPPENLYMRGMFFLICCFFGLFMANYIRKYEQLLNVLLVSVRRFEQLTGNAKDMIYRMTLPKGEYEFVSSASSIIFGYSPGEFYKRPHLLNEMVHPDWKEYYEGAQRQLLAGEIAPFYEYQIINKAGKTRWVNQRITLYYDESHAPMAIEGIVTDMTSSKAATQESQ